MIMLIIMGLLVVALAGGAVILQIFLSKKESKLLGLVLPFLSFATSLWVAFGMAAFNYSTSTESQDIDMNGEIIEQIEKPNADVHVHDFPNSATVGVVFTNFNIPTAVLLAVYFACRESLKKKKEIVQMSIQDLE